MIQQIVFVAVVLAALGVALWKYRALYQKINLGRDDKISGETGQRIKNMFLVAFGQKKMFKRIIPALLHLSIYVAFVITQIELIEIFIDGFSGNHRTIWHLIEGSAISFLYPLAINLIEILTLLVIPATFIFLLRRNALKIPRLSMDELSGWPKLDANLILFAELILAFCILGMNAADLALQEKGIYASSPQFLVSSSIALLLNSIPGDSLIAIERVCWWGHFLTVLGFIVYLPFSKHLHIILAFPNVYFGRLSPKGYMNNMEVVTKEIKLMMNPDTAFAAPADGVKSEIPTFGAKEVTDLSWKNLLDAYSCTECGRCAAVCPANTTGKKLSPRKIMMDTRDRMDMIHAANGSTIDSKFISDDFISVEELRACTTCNACVEECPVNINPLDIILQLRRNLILEESNSPEEWNLMFSNIENNGAPWQFSQADRFNWANELKN